MSTYTPIATVTLSSTTFEFAFNAIPQYFTDLILVADGNTLAGPTDNALRFNNDSTTCSLTGLLNDGSTGTSYGTSAAYIPTNGLWSSSGRSSRIVHIMNYSNPNIFKTVLVRTNNGTQIAAQVGTYPVTDPITSMQIWAGGSNFVAGTTFNLYGIQEGGGYALGGDIVTTDGTYWYHAFLSSGVFTPTKNLLVDYAVVGGGGSGGQPGSGGGAGGFRTFTSQSLTANTSYVAVVGAGGVAQSYNRGVNGNNSSFNSAISAGGGGGGGYEQNGFSGGSGGGAGGRGTGNGTGGTGNTPSTSPSQGNNGGTGTGDLQAGGGGGGAGAAGGNATNSSNTAQGGVGSTAISSWGLATGTGQNDSGTVYFAGGGGGSRNVSSNFSSAGGLGGGGAGQWSASTSGSPQSGTANTGGGGGACGGNMAFAGNGGSGIVIVRYAV
jgi:hypothetical protein